MNAAEETTKPNRTSAPGPRTQLSISFVQRMGQLALVMAPFAAQSLYAGISSGMRVRAQLQDAADLCEHNKDLSLESAVLNACLLRDVKDQAIIADLNGLVNEWGESTVSLEQWAERLSARFLQHYIVFLVFLALVTVTLFFAIEKKAGRLDQLFRKASALAAST